MRKVHCYGKLTEFVPAPLPLQVATAGEAIRAISMQVPGFMKALQEGSYEIVRGKAPDDGMWLDLEDINTFNLGQSDLHIVPVVAGAGRGKSTAKIVIGAALVGTAIFLSGGTLATPLAATGLLSGVTYGNVAMVGLAIALTGVSGLMAKAQNKKTDSDDSFALNGPTNVYEQGNPVPLVYGEVITGGVLISGGIDIEDISAHRT